MSARTGYNAGGLDAPIWTDDDERGYQAFLSVVVIPALTKRSEIDHEYAVCIECNGTDGEHFDGCLGIN